MVLAMNAPIPELTDRMRQMDLGGSQNVGIAGFGALIRFGEPFERRHQRRQPSDFAAA